MSIKTIAVVTFALSVPVGAWGVDQRPCGESQIRARAARFLADLGGQSGREAGQEEYENFNLTKKVDPLMGGVTEVSDGVVTVGISEIGCYPVSFSRPECEPEKWGRTELESGRRRLKTPEELENDNVRIPEDEALLRAFEVANEFVGDETVKVLELVERGLRDEGDSLVYHYRWKDELVESGLRVGLRELTIRVNPATGCVSQVSLLSALPARNSLVSAEVAKRTAIQTGSQNERPNCVVAHGSLIEEFVDSVHSNKYWAIVVDCKRDDGSVERATVRVNALTGDVVEEKRSNE